MLNSLVLVGRLISDPELKKTKTNKSVCTFTIAINKGKEKAKFFDCTVWDKGAEYISTYGRKGNIVGVVAEWNYNEYVDKDGKKQRAHEALCSRVQLLSVNKKEEKTEEPSFFTKEMNVSEEFKMPEWDEMPWNQK